jgi:MbtH protein
MSSQESHDYVRRYKVVVNEEEQYSIWPEYRAEPLGWKSVGIVGTKQECLAHIKEVWVDLTPLSVRKQLAASHNSSSGQSPRL